MSRNSFLLPVFMLITGAAITSCKDDNGLGTANYPTPGSAIWFDATVEKPNVRTIYEDRLQINWEKGDQIGIYSDDVECFDASSPSSYATYQIEEVNDFNHPHHGSFSPVDKNKYLIWGKDLNKECVFYGAYPAERIKIWPDEADRRGTFSMVYNTNQICTVSSSFDGKFTTTPDMKNAYMIAKNVVTPIGDHILLSFDPIMTTLDIKVTAGNYEVGTGIIQPVRITGVSVIMPKKLNGETLDYQINEPTNGNITAPRGNLTNMVKENISESVFVGIANDQENYIDLYEGESVNLTAFLPPISHLEGTKIKIHTAGVLNFMLTINKDLLQQSKIDIKLPNVSPNLIKPNNWISQLPNETKLKQMSIPVYKFEGNYGEGDETDLQKMDILLNKGVRAFIANHFLSDGIGWESLDDRFVKKCEAFLDENPDEFIIVWVNTQDNLPSWNLSRPAGWLDFPETIGQARKHVIYLRQRDPYGSGKHYFTNIDNKEALFYNQEVYNVADFNMNNTAWNFQWLNDANLCKDIYNKISGNNETTGGTGLVCVSVSDNEDKLDIYDYDTFIQSVIDCNFKFRTIFE